MSDAIGWRASHEPLRLLELGVWQRDAVEYLTHPLSRLLRDWMPGAVLLQPPLRCSTRNLPQCRIGIATEVQLASADYAGGISSRQAHV